MTFWNQKTFCLVTGASRGIGQTIAIEFAKKVAAGSVFLLLARSEAALDETKAAILGNGSNRVQVATEAVELSKPNSKEYLELIESALTSTEKKPSDFDHALLVHNAGTGGDLTKGFCEMDNIDELREYFDLNLVSMIALTSRFFQVFSDESKQRSVVQISSGAAEYPVPRWGLYCTGKAARDMVTRVIAAENPTISTMSYAPGPTETDLYAEGIASWKKESDAISSRIPYRPPSTPLHVVTKLMKALESQKYTKGEHVDLLEIK